MELDTPCNELLVPAGKHWSSVKRYASVVSCSLLEAQKGEAEEAETVSAMALLSVDAEQGSTDCNPRYGPPSLLLSHVCHLVLVPRPILDILGHVAHNIYSPPIALVHPSAAHRLIY